MKAAKENQEVCAEVAPLQNRSNLGAMPHWNQGCPVDILGDADALLKMLVEVGRREHLRRIVGHIAGENMTMKRVSEQAGFDVRFDGANSEWRAEIQLGT